MASSDFRLNQTMDSLKQIGLSVHDQYGLPPFYTKGSASPNNFVAKVVERHNETKIGAYYPVNVLCYPILTTEQLNEISADLPLHSIYRVADCGANYFIVRHKDSEVPKHLLNEVAEEIEKLKRPLRGPANEKNPIKIDNW